MRIEIKCVLLATALFAAPIGTFGSAHAQTQDDGYVYLECEYRDEVGGYGPWTTLYKIGQRQWYEYDIATGSWGRDWCQAYANGWVGTCTFGDAGFRLEADFGPKETSTTISRVDGTISMYTPRGLHYVGMCGAVAPPSPPEKRKF